MKLHIDSVAVSDGGWWMPWGTEHMFFEGERIVAMRQMILAADAWWS